MTLTQTLETIVWGFSVILTIYGFYFMIMSIFAFLPLKASNKYEPKNKFGIVIAARNEEVVIGNLVDSLKQQNYPKELYDIIVVPNNCKDNTKGAAIAHGAKIYEPKSIIRSKGDVLKEVFDHLLTREYHYDAFLVFDADNVVDENFIAEMNNAIIDGSEVAQGYRSSKNPYDNYMTGNSTIYYGLVNRFFNRPRTSIGMSGMINGTGFMVKASLLRELGGYRTTTLTEDIEFSTQIILKGKKINWISEAITYDEQPDTFDASWKQRMRWTIGTIQCNKVYLGQLIKGIGKKNGLQHFDFAMFYIAPLTQVLSLFSAIAIIALNLLYLENNVVKISSVLSLLVVSTAITYVASVFIGIAVMKLEKWSVRKSYKGILTFAIYLITWLPINIISIVKPDTTWHEIKHNRKIAIGRKSGPQ